MIILILIILGLCFGSFVNAFVYRFYQNNKAIFEDNKPKPKKNNRPKAKAAQSKNLSILNGRSICPSCKHQLGWLDLIPVFSWLSLLGRCRYCKRSISFQYPLVEAVTAALFVISYIYWPSDVVSAEIIVFGFWLFYLVGFMALTVFDIKWMILPNKIVYPLILSFIPMLAFGLLAGLFDFRNVVDMAVGGVFLSGLFWLLFQLSKGKWIGGGDVKLAVLLGLLAGTITQAFLVMFIASILGTIISGAMLVVSKRFKMDRQIPFGPYLMGATVIVVLWGSTMIDWYMKLVLG